MSPSINRLAGVVTSHLPRVKRDILQMTKSLIAALFPPRHWRGEGLGGGANGERSDSSLSGEEERSESTSSRRAKLTRVRSSLKDASYRNTTAKLSINTLGLRRERKRKKYGVNFHSLSFTTQFSSSIQPFFCCFFSPLLFLKQLETATAIDMLPPPLPLSPARPPHYNYGA